MTDFDWLQLARKHASSDPLTPSEQTALANAREAVDNDPARPNPTPVEQLQAYKALMLARTPETWQALLQGQSVPISELDQEWVKRYGLR